PASNSLTPLGFAERLTDLTPLACGSLRARFARLRRARKAQPTGHAGSVLRNEDGWLAPKDHPCPEERTPHTPGQLPERSLLAPRSGARGAAQPSGVNQKTIPTPRARAAPASRLGTRSTGSGTPPREPRSRARRRARASRGSDGSRPPGRRRRDPRRRRAGRRAGRRLRRTGDGARRAAPAP